MLGEVYILNERGLQAVLILKGSPRIKLIFSDDEILEGSALAAYLIKVSSQEPLRPFIKIKDEYIFYVNDYMLVGRMVNKDKLKDDILWMHKLNSFLVNKKAVTVDEIIDALIDFIRTEFS